MIEATDKTDKIFKGQKWVELYGKFTIVELENILSNLEEANKNTPEG